MQDFAYVVEDKEWYTSYSHLLSPQNFLLNLFHLFIRLEPRLSLISTREYTG